MSSRRSRPGAHRRHGSACSGRPGGQPIRRLRRCGVGGGTRWPACRRVRDPATNADPRWVRGPDDVADGLGGEPGPAGDRSPRAARRTRRAGHRCGLAGSNRAVDGWHGAGRHGIHGRSRRGGRTGGDDGGPPARAHLDVLVGWAAGTATSSDDYHAPLGRNAASLVGSMSELGAIARSAARAVERGDTIALAEAMDRTWMIRQACAPLRADHAALVELVRSTGMHATTPGSGGSVVAPCLDERVTLAAIAALGAAGCAYLRCALA